MFSRGIETDRGRKWVNLITGTLQFSSSARWLLFFSFFFDAIKYQTYTKICFSQRDLNPQPLSS